MLNKIKTIYAAHCGRTEIHMTTLEIFEKVNLTVPIEQRRFFNLFADSVSELEAMFDGFVFCEGASRSLPAALTDNNAVRPLYHNAIVDNILFLSGQGESYKSEFLRKSRNAFLKYWRDNAKGRRVKRMRW